VSLAQPGDAWSLGEEESRPFIKRALEVGINFFDTANRHSLGSSEEILGRAIKDFARRDEIVIATKVYGRMRPGPNGAGLSKAIMGGVAADGEPKVRIHLSPAASPLRTRPPSPIATGTDPLVRVPARWYDADQQWICSSNIDVDDLSKAIAFYLQAAGLRLGRRFGSLGLEMLGTSSTIYPRAKPDGTTASWR